MIVLDTNVISEVFRPTPDPGAIEWLESLCRAHGAMCATRNEKDFAETGVRVLNPWTFDAGMREVMAW